MNDKLRITDLLKHSTTQIEIINGIPCVAALRNFYIHVSTTPDLVEKICYLYTEKFRVNIYYGDTDTGELWENIETGTICKTTGFRAVPILVYNSRSLGGSAIRCNRILKIESSNQTRYPRTYYKHPQLK